MPEPQRDPASRTRTDDLKWNRRVMDRCAQIARIITGRENFYRDVWLFIITGVVLWALIINQQASDSAKKLATQIQMERRNTIFSDCEAQNSRHNNTIEELGKDVVIAKRHAPNELVMVLEIAGLRIPPAILTKITKFEQAQVIGSFASSKLLIDALQPSQNCSLAVKKATHLAN